jgi:large subunit ribosomal protein L15
MADETPGLTLHELKPAPGSHRERKRIGRGHGSGSGKTAGRGQKGQKSRSGSHSMRPGFEGGQMPLYMRLGKLRGPNHKKSMPMGPFRTRTTPVNVAALERFDEGVEVTPDLLRSAGVVRTLKHPIKILGKGELSTRLTVTAHAFSKRAVEVIEAAGGTAVRVDGAPAVAEPEPKPKAKAKAKAKAAPKAQAEPEPEATDEAEQADAEPAEPEADAEE